MFSLYGLKYSLVINLTPSSHIYIQAVPEYHGQCSAIYSQKKNSKKVGNEPSKMVIFICISISDKTALRNSTKIGVIQIENMIHGHLKAFGIVLAHIL